MSSAYNNFDSKSDSNYYNANANSAKDNNADLDEEVAENVSNLDEHKKVETFNSSIAKKNRNIVNKDV